MTRARAEFKDLLERARAGDRKAIAALLEQYQGPLRVYARVQLGRALRRYADSIDLVQSAQKSLMLALWSNKYDFADPENLLALAKTILKRKVALLAQRARRQRPLDEPSGEGAAAAETLAALDSREADPAQAAAWRDALDQVGRQLSAAERQIMALALQGYRRKEVAEKMGYDPDVFRVYWSRLTRRLRQSGLLHGWLDD